MLHTHLHLHVALTSRTNGRSLGNFQKANALSEIGERWEEKLVFQALNEVTNSSVL